MCFQIFNFAFLILTHFTAFSQAIAAPQPELPYKIIPYIKHIQPEIKEHSLVAFDIDLTLLVPAQSVGMPQWVKARQDHLLRIYSDPQEAYDRLTADFSGVYNLLGFLPAEKETASFLSQLKQKNIATTALTARSLSLMHATRLHLKDNGVTFNSPFHSPHTGHHTRILEPHETPEKKLHHHVAIDRGVVYSSGQHKGMVLEHAIQRSKYDLKHLIFVDDEPHNLYKVSETCKQQNWDCSLFLYTGTRNHIDNFDLQVANKEWEKLRSKIRLPEQSLDAPTQSCSAPQQAKTL
ncbi:MAG: DUF2608 domain-containing protein [Oligoflexales bacterium]